MQTRQLNSSNFPIPDKLLDNGFQARSEYAKHLEQMQARKKSEEAAKLAEEERLALLRSLEEDKKRKTALDKITEATKTVREYNRYHSIIINYYKIIY